MQKIIAITLLSFLFVCLEFFLFNHVHPLFTPNLLLLLVIFVNLWLGIRFSLLTAVMAGLLKEGFSTDFFGFHIFVFVVCAYAATVLRPYLYQRGSTFSRYLLVGFVLVFNFILQLLFHLDLSHLNVTFFTMGLPEIFLTLILMEFVFKSLRLCASRFFV